MIRSEILYLCQFLISQVSYLWIGQSQMLKEYYEQFVFHQPNEYIFWKYINNHK